VTALRHARRPNVLGRRHRQPRGDRRRFNLGVPHAQPAEVSVGTGGGRGVRRPRARRGPASRSPGAADTARRRRNHRADGDDGGGADSTRSRRRREKNALGLDSADPGPRDGRRAGSTTPSTHRRQRRDARAAATSKTANVGAPPSPTAAVAPRETAKEKRAREVREREARESEARVAAARQLAGPATGTVKIAVSPWGLVEVDGTSSGAAPPITELTLAEGRHQIVIRNGDYAPFTAQVQVTAGQTVSLRHKFGS
jgi:hypothetical protein